MVKHWRCLRALRKFVLRNTERFVLYVSGVIISVVVAALIEEVITFYEALLFGLTIILVLSGILLFSEASQRIQTLAGVLETSARYVEEPYRELEGVKYRGRIYEDLIRLVDEAEYEILILTVPFKEKGKAHQTSMHPARDRYLATLEENIRRHEGREFRYVRILQSTRGSEGAHIGEVIGDANAKHCYRILDMARQSIAPDLELAVMEVEAQRVISFMVIDRRHVVTEVVGFDSEGRTYAAGFLFVQDRGGKFAEHFCQYFRDLERRAKMLELADFGSAISSKNGQH